MGQAKVTRVSVETLTRAPSQARVTRESVETLTRGTSQARLDRISVETLVRSWQRTPAYRDGTAVSGATSTTASGVIPASAVVGDVALVLMQAGGAATPTTTPPGLVLVDQLNDGSSSQTYAYTKVIGPGDAGSTLAWTLSASVKFTVTIAVITGADNTAPVNAYNKKTDTAASASRVAPTATTTADNCLVIEYVNDRGNANTLWSAPSGFTKRLEAYGTGSGTPSCALADANNNEPIGTWGGDTWTEALSTQTHASEWVFAFLPANIPLDVVLTGAPANYTMSVPAGTLVTGQGVNLVGAPADYTYAVPAGSVATGQGVNLVGVPANYSYSVPAGVVTAVQNVYLTAEPVEYRYSVPAGTLTAIDRKRSRPVRVQPNSKGGTVRSNTKTGKVRGS